MQTFALGSSEETARLCGVPVARRKIWIYLLKFFMKKGGSLSFGFLGQFIPNEPIGRWPRAKTSQEGSDIKAGATDDKRQEPLTMKASNVLGGMLPEVAYVKGLVWIDEIN